MATDRSTDDYKQILIATVGSLLQHPTPQNKMAILAADAVKIADLVTEELDKAKKAEEDKEKQDQDKDKAGDAKDKPPEPSKGPSIPPPPTPAPSPAPAGK